MTGDNGSPAYMLREGVEFRLFPDSAVVFHSDSGDTFVLAPESGAIVDLLAGVTAPLTREEILGRMGGSRHCLPEMAPDRLDALLQDLETCDLLRTVGAS